MRTYIYRDKGHESTILFNIMLIMLALEMAIMHAVRHVIYNKTHSMLRLFIFSFISEKENKLNKFYC